MPLITSIRRILTVLFGLVLLAAAPPDTDGFVRLPVDLVVIEGDRSLRRCCCSIEWRGRLRHEIAPTASSGNAFDGIVMRLVSCVHHGGMPKMML